MFMLPSRTTLTATAYIASCSYVALLPSTRSATNVNFMKIIQFLISRVLLNPIVLAAVALVTGIVGIIIVLDMPAYTKQMSRAERLLPASATSIAHSASDNEVLLEGRISPSNSKLHQQFVAYVREEYRDEILDGDDMQDWVEVKRETPPFLLRLPDGDVQIANDDYIFDTTAVTIEEAAPTFTKGAVQIRGFTVDSPVMVIGRVAPGGTVVAEFLYAGSRAAYLAEMRRLATGSLPVGIGLLLVCALTTTLCIREIRRFLREIAAERVQEEMELSKHRPHQERLRRQNQ